MNRSSLRRVKVLGGLIALLAMSALQAQELDHAPLARDASLSISVLLAQVLENAPQALEGDARTAQARAMTAQRTFQLPRLRV